LAGLLLRDSSGEARAVLEHLQEFAKLTWYPQFFGKTRKNALQQFSISTCHFSQLGIIPPRKYARTYLRASPTVWYITCHPSKFGKTSKNQSPTVCQSDLPNL
jgi:hypothetical protein